MSCTLDAVPLFPLPPPTRAQSMNNPSFIPTGMQSVCIAWKAIAPSDTDLIGMLVRVAQFSYQLNLEIDTADANKTLHWTNVLGTLCHEILRTQKPYGNTSSEVIREACRLALLLFLAPVRRLLAVTTFTTAVQLKKLAALMFEQDIEWKGLHVLKHWIIIMGILEAIDENDFRRWLLLWRAEDGAADSLSLHPLLHKAMGIMWIDSIHGKLFQELQAKLWAL